jgi:hypothetical protein
MTEPILNPDTIGSVLDQDTDTLATEVGEGVGALTPENFTSILAGKESTGTFRKTDLASQVAMALGRGTDSEAIALAEAEPLPDNALAQAAENVFLELESTLLNAEKGFEEIAPEHMQSTLHQIVDAQKSINDMRSSPVSTELAVIQAATTIPLSEALREQLAFNFGVRNEIHRLLDEQGKLDFVSDIGGNFIPLRQWMDFDDVKDNIKEHADLKDAIDGESIVSMVGSWQALPVARKEALFPALTEAVLAATGVDYSFGLGIEALKTDKNVLNAAGILLRFLQPEGGERAKLETQVLSAIDIVGLGGADVISAGLRATKSGTAIAKLNDIPIDVRKTMESIFGNAREYAAKKHNSIKLVADSGDVKEAARLNVAAVTDEKAAKTFNVPREDAFTNSLPIWQGSGRPEYIKGISPEVNKVMNGHMTKSSGFVRSMTTESELMRLGVLTAPERKLVIKNFYDEMDLKAEDLLQEGIHLTDMRVIKQDEFGFTFEYKLRNEAEQYIKAGETDGEVLTHTVTDTRSWRINQVTGDFEETTKDLARPSSSSIPFQSPAARSVTKPGEAQDFNDTVKRGIQATDLATSTKSQLNDRLREATTDSRGKFLSRKAYDRLSAIEIAGDEYVNKGSQVRGRVFTEQELIAGIQTSQGTIRLRNPEEIGVYYKRRAFADEMWAIQNFISRRELELQGAKFLRLKGDDVFGIPMDTVGAAKASTKDKAGYRAWISNEDNLVDLSDEMIDAQYDKGFVLVRLKQDWNTSGAGSLAKGGEFVEYAFVPTEKLKELPLQVIHYKYGYVTKVNEGIEFVVQQVTPIKKAGQPSASKKQALRAFASKKDAEKFMASQAATLVAKNPGISMEQAKALFQIEDASLMSQFDRMDNNLSGSGGLITGHRSQDELLMGLEGVPIERMSPSEAYSRAIDVLGNGLAVNEWRLGERQRWLNTVRKMDNTIKIEGFDNTKLPNTPIGKALESEREYINTVTRMPTRQESLFEAQAQKVHDWILEGSRGMGIKKDNIKSALWLKHADPISAILTANMHIFLGALNPAQLYVQASAAVVGLSLSKIAEVPNIIRMTAQIAAMDNIRDNAAFAKAVDLLRIDKQLSPEDVEAFHWWRRAGLYESVRNNADLHYISSTGMGITNDILRKLENFSLLVFRTGELTNRRLSFLAAFDRWRRKNPSKQMTDLILSDDVLREANLTTLELNSGNKAFFQGGAGTSAPQRILSMATQFQQVLAKTVELSLKTQKRGGFSLEQKRRIALGQLVMFGAAGVPIVNMIAPAIIDWVGAENVPEETIESINQGVTGLISQQGFGADVEVASRASLLGGVAETFQDIWTSKDPMWQKMLSVTGISGQRAGQAIVDITNVLQSQSATMAKLYELEPLLLGDRRSSSDMDVPTMLSTAGDIARILATIPSSTRNILKARMMHNAHRILDRRGRVVIDASEDGGFNFATELAVALGLSTTTREATHYALKRSGRDFEEEAQVAAQVIVKAHYEYVYLHEMNPKYAQALHNIQQLVHESLDNDELLERTRAIVTSRIMNIGTSLEEIELRKFYKRTAPERLTEAVILDAEKGINPSNIFNKRAIVQPFSHVMSKESTSTKDEENK